MEYIWNGNNPYIFPMQKFVYLRIRYTSFKPSSISLRAGRGKPRYNYTANAPINCKIMKFTPDSSIAKIFLFICHLSTFIVYWIYKIPKSQKLPHLDIKFVFQINIDKMYKSVHLKRITSNIHCTYVASLQN